MLEKTVTLYLLDRDENGNGDARGCIEYTVGNWEGVAYKIPRTQKERCDKQCDDSKSTLGKRLKQAGLYCLLGKTNEGKTTVYVGKADSSEGVWKRAANGKHRENANIDKGWTEAVIFVHSSSEKSFLDGPGLNCIEKKFYPLLKDEEGTGGYEVLNNEPSAGSDGTKEQQGVLDNFAEKAKRLMMIILWYFKNSPTDKADEVSGCDDTEAQSQHEEEISSKNDGEDKLLLFLTYTPKGSQKKYRAEGIYVIDEGFTLREGSEICPEETPKCRERIKKMRKEHWSKVKKCVLISDLEFGSSSLAAEFVCGGSKDGYIVWQDANGIPLGELLKKKA